MAEPAMSSAVQAMVRFFMVFSVFIYRKESDSRSELVAVPTAPDRDADVNLARIGKPAFAARQPFAATAELNREQM